MPLQRNCDLLYRFLCLPLLILKAYVSFLRSAYHALSTKLLTLLHRCLSPVFYCATVSQSLFSFKQCIISVSADNTDKIHPSLLGHHENTCDILVKTRSSRIKTSVSSNLQCSFVPYPAIFKSFTVRGWRHLQQRAIKSDSFILYGL